jgi:putative ATPase
MNTYTQILRPTTISEFLGQSHLIGEGKPISKMIETGSIGSMIFWGPPASGKTTLARILANTKGYEFRQLSAVVDGKKDLLKLIVEAQKNLEQNIKTILFIDEIHRWSKSQQDTLLPYTENGTIILIGATTENPSFTIISPLLSRTRVFVFHPHTKEDIIIGINKCIEKFEIKIEKELIDYLAALSDGDIRFALNTLEIAQNSAQGSEINREIIENSAQKFLRYDKSGEEHYNIISAVHKSLRSSNPDAALYWVCRMLVSGEDPLYICRRLLRFASEDIGNANPNALLLANQTYIACQNLGQPECEVVIAQLVEYLGNSKKSNSTYTALASAKSDATQFGNLEVPLHFRNAPTKLMKDLGYGKNYEYDPTLESKKSTQECFPEILKNRKYY